MNNIILLIIKRYRDYRYLIGGVKCKMSIPNYLTLFRFFLIPVFIYTFYNYSNYLLPFSIFILAGITDMLDGYIARKNSTVTKLGKLLDPLADKFMLLSVLFVLTDRKLIPVWIIIVVLVKELFLIVGSGVLYRKNIITEASWYGKLSTVLFYMAIIITVFINDLIGTYVLIAAVISTLYAGIRYAVHYFKVTKKMLYAK